MTLASDFKATPYWWNAAPVGAGNAEAPPARADVVVVGSGITGIHTALELAKNGRSVVVVEAGEIGCGSSRRNNGTIVPYLYLKQYQLEEKFGDERGAAIGRIAADAVDYLLETCESLAIDAQIKELDRYFLALTEKHCHQLHHSAELQARSGIKTGWQPIAADELEARTGLLGYAGGVFTSRSLAMHPGLYHQGVVRAAEAAGATTVAQARVTALRSGAGGYIVSTSRGEITAREVVVATNGYTGAPFDFAGKRLMNVRIYMAATEPLADSNAAARFAARHLLVDSKTNITWLRPTPDGTRLLVGGRGGMGGDDPEEHARVLHADMVRLIPELESIKIEHCWYGIEGFPLNLVPHLSSRDGLHHVLGFCGVGMTVGGFLGNRLARRIVGDADDSPLDGVSFPIVPLRNLYAGAGVAYIDLMDWWETRARKRAGFRAVR